MTMSSCPDEPPWLFVPRCCSAALPLSDSPCYFHTVIDDWADLGLRVAGARSSLRMTQEELANRLGVDRTALVRMESGERRITALELSALAAELDRPIDWFFVESPPAVVSRRDELAGDGTETAMERLVERLARDVDGLIGQGLLSPAPLDPLPVPGSLDDAAAIAEQVRRMAGLEDGPVLDLLAVVETLGLTCFALLVPETMADGAYVALSPGGVALVNAAHDAGRRRFTLAHELGHHIIQDEYATDLSLSSASSDIERLINSFAIHFLLPRAALTRDWARMQGGDEPRDAALRLAIDYRVSWSALAGQLRNCGLIDHPAMQRLQADPPRKSDYLALGRFPTEELVPPAISSGYIKAVLRGYQAERLSAAKAVSLLHGLLSEDELPPPQRLPMSALYDDVAALL